MLNNENVQQFGVTNLTELFFLNLVVLILFFPSAALAAGHPCTDAATHLRGDHNVVANRGGLWTLMEQKGLKDNSVIGMQADSKLARAVGQFEELCESGKKPSKQLYESIQKLLGDARIIFNPNSSAEKITKSITTLIKGLDALLEKMK